MRSWRPWLIAGCVLGQLSVLAFMVYGRETVIHHGTKISINTAPIDPRDPFRGDFVRLRYGLNSLDYAPTLWQPADHIPAKGEKVYAVLEPQPSGLYDVSHFTNIQPQTSGGRQPLFLRGRIDTTGRWQRGGWIDARFGIEQLFVQQGSGIDIENRRGIRGGLQNAMQAQISVGQDGTAVLTGFTWSPLAIGLVLTDSFTLDQQRLNVETNTDNINPNLNNSTGPISVNDAQREPASIILTIDNVSEEKITLNNPGDNCGFSLEPAARGNSEYAVPEGVCADLAAQAVTLEAGGSMVLNIDLSAPRWHMSRPIDDAISTNDLRRLGAENEWFRLVYRSDGVADSAFWQGELVSQAFSVNGIID